MTLRMLLAGQLEVILVGAAPESCRFGHNEERTLRRRVARAGGYAVGAAFLDAHDGLALARDPLRVAGSLLPRLRGLCAFHLLSMALILNPEKALIFRITHRSNLPWILDHGLHARTGEIQDPNFVEIGNTDLIQRRRPRAVSVGPRGLLADYVPFYFTPFSIMLYNILTGYGGVRRMEGRDIVFVVSSMRRVAELGIPFAFTSEHALPVTTEYFDDLEHLDRIDWPLLQSRNFQHDPDDPGRKERYQAEALIWKKLPLDAILGLCCHSSNVRMAIEREVASRGLNVPVHARREWYF